MKLSSSLICLFITIGILIFCFVSRLALNIKAFRSLEKRFTESSLGNSELRAIFKSGGNPPNCSEVANYKSVAASYDLARWATSPALQGLKINDHLWYLATSTKDSRGSNGAPLALKEDDNWIFLSGSNLPYFCSLGMYDNMIMVVFRSTASESEFLQADLGDNLIDRYGYQDMSRLLQAGFSVPCPPQATLFGDENFQNYIPKVQAGALFAFLHSGLEERIWSEIERRLAGREVSLAFFGHSLGAGIAAMCLARGLERCRNLGMRSKYIILTACPKSGNAAFRNLFTNGNVTSICFANEADAVPWLPFSTMPDPFSERGTFLV